MKETFRFRFMAGGGRSNILIIMLRISQRLSWLDLCSIECVRSVGELGGTPVCMNPHIKASPEGIHGLPHKGVS